MLTLILSIGAVCVFVLMCGLGFALMASSSAADEHHARLLAEYEQKKKRLLGS